MPQAPARVVSSSASSLSASLIQEEIQPANNTLQEPTMPAPRNASHHFVRAKEEPPYSFAAEVEYFFKQGVPLVLSGVLEWGVPPLSAMVIAGHVKEGSVTLQAAIGFSRVYYNVTCLMPCISLLAYIRTVVPGCVGAQRIDRIPRYFQRSMLLSFALLIPSLVLQLFSEQFLLAVNVPSDVAAAVGTYTRIMILTASIFLLECHLEQLFISLGFAKVDAFIGFLSGLGIDIGCTYWLVYVKGYGMYGMALKEIAVKLSRVLLWLIFAGVFGLWQTLFVPSRIARLEPLLSRREVRIFFSQVLPKYIQSLSGWLIFELQVCPSEVEFEARAASCDVLLNSSLPSASTRDSPADGPEQRPRHDRGGSRGWGHLGPGGERSCVLDVGLDYGGQPQDPEASRASRRERRGQILSRAQRTCGRDRWIAQYAASPRVRSSHQQARQQRPCGEQRAGAFALGACMPCTDAHNKLDHRQPVDPGRKALAQCVHDLLCLLHNWRAFCCAGRLHQRADHGD